MHALAGALLPRAGSKAAAKCGRPTNPRMLGPTRACSIDATGKHTIVAWRDAAPRARRGQFLTPSAEHHRRTRPCPTRPLGLESNSVGLTQRAETTRQVSGPAVGWMLRRARRKRAHGAPPAARTLPPKGTLRAPQRRTYFEKAKQTMMTWQGKESTCEWGHRTRAG